LQQGVRTERREKGKRRKKRGGRRIMTNPKKCGNLACTCVPAGNAKYCSPHCEGIGKKMEIVCLCGHSDCGGNVKDV
jgi:hypothetical protein